MSRPTARVWARPEDEAWADRLRLRLALRADVGPDHAEDVLDDVHRACTETGDGARELFGPADAYAELVEADRVPPEVRAAADVRSWSPSPGWEGFLVVGGVMGVQLCVVLGVVQGWTLRVTPEGLAVAALFVAVWGGMAAGLQARGRGRLRLGWALWAATPCVAAAIAVAGEAGGEERTLVHLPVLVPALACVLLLALGLRLPATGSRTGGGTGERSGGGDAPASPDAWFDRLHGLLRGAYWLPRADARRATEDARAAWLDSGAAHPRDVLGTPELHASQLVDGSPGPARGRDRAEDWFLAVLGSFWALLSGVGLVEDLVDGGWAWGLLWPDLPGLLLGGSVAVAGWRRVLRRRARARAG